VRSLYEHKHQTLVYLLTQNQCKSASVEDWLQAKAVSICTSLLTPSFA